MPTEQFSASLQKFGCRLTPPRRKIIDVFACTARHLSAEEIYFLVHKAYPKIGIATVYRTLELLAKMGVIMKFDFGQHKSRYELASEFDSARHKHNHIICTNCGKIVNYTDYAAEESLAMQSKRIALEKKYSFNIKQHQLQYFGECKKCTIRRAA